METQPTRTATAAGTMDNDPTRPFHILLSNFFNHSIRIAQHQRVPTAAPLDKTIIHLLSHEMSAGPAEEDPIGNVPVLVEDDSADWWQTIRIWDTFLV